MGKLTKRKKPLNKPVDNQNRSREANISAQVVPDNAPFSYDSFWCNVKEQFTCSVTCMITCGGEAPNSKGKLTRCKEYPELISDPFELDRLKRYIQRFPYQVAPNKLTLTRLGVIEDKEIAASGIVVRRAVQLSPVIRKAVKI